MTYRCRLPPARWLAVLLLCVAAPLQAALRIELHAQLPALDAAQVRASEQLIDDVLAHAPPAIAAESSLVLQLRWRDDLPAHVQGRAHGRELGLDRSLLQPLLQAGQRGEHHKGFRPSESNRCWSRSHSGLPVVRSFSP